MVGTRKKQYDQFHRLLYFFLAFALHRQCEKRADKVKGLRPYPSMVEKPMIRVLGIVCVRLDGYTTHVSNLVVQSEGLTVVQGIASLLGMYSSLI